MYKLLAKLLARRLKEVMGEIVYEWKGVFVGGCWILDFSLVVRVHRLIDLKRREKRGGVVSK